MVAVMTSAVDVKAAAGGEGCRRESVDDEGISLSVCLAVWLISLLALNFLSPLTSPLFIRPVPGGAEKSGTYELCKHLFGLDFIREQIHNIHKVCFNLPRELCV